MELACRLLLAVIVGFTVGFVFLSIAWDDR
jgi:hypothetical protein